MNEENTCSRISAFCFICLLERVKCICCCCVVFYSVILVNKWVYLCVWVSWAGESCNMFTKYCLKLDNSGLKAPDVTSCMDHERGQSGRVSSGSLHNWNTSLFLCTTFLENASFRLLRSSHASNCSHKEIPEIPNFICICTTSYVAFKNRHRLFALSHKRTEKGVEVLTELTRMSLGIVCGSSIKSKTAGVRKPTRLFIHTCEQHPALPGQQHPCQFFPCLPLLSFCLSSLLFEDSPPTWFFPSGVCCCIDWHVVETVKLLKQKSVICKFCFCYWLMLLKLTRLMKQISLFLPGEM